MDSFLQTSDIRTQEDRLNIIEAQLNSEKLIKKIELFLTGHEDKDGQLFYNEDARLINDGGAKTLCMELTTNLSNNVILGNITVVEAHSLAEEYEKDLTEQLVLNYLIWELNINKMNTIVNRLGNLNFSNLTRAIDGNTHKGLVQVSSITQTSQLVEKDLMDKGKPNLISKMFKRGD